MLWVSAALLNLKSFGNEFNAVGSSEARNFRGIVE